MALLCEKYNTEFTTRNRVSDKKMREMLLALGYKYLPRKRAFIKRKYATVNINRFYIHNLLVESRVEFIAPTGLWQFKEPTYWFDEAYLISGELQAWHWCRPGDMSRMMDFSVGGYRRLALLGACGSLPCGFEDQPTMFKAYWNQAWKSKTGRKWHGKCGADQVYKFFDDILLPAILQLPQDRRQEAIIFVDNWSAHLRLKDECRGLNDEQLAAWVQSELHEAGEGEGLREFGLLDAGLNSHWEGHRHTLLTLIDDWNLKHRELDALCNDYGVKLHYLAPFYSPSSPQEYHWAAVKSKFRKDSEETGWAERLERAFQITPFETKQMVSRSVKYCLEELRKSRLNAAPAVPHVVAGGAAAAEQENSDSYSDSGGEEGFDL